MSNIVGWFEICGTDAVKTREFYGKLFGWTYNVMPMPDGTEYAMLAAGEGGIGGGLSKTFGPHPYSAIYIQVDSPKAYLEKAEKMGGKTIVPETTIPGMVTFAMFTDPDGIVVGLYRSERA
jgi:predicted enzyme related to lactoylglutathione lyase